MIIFSTVSSCLNSLSAVTWKDLMEPQLKKFKIQESRKTLITKILGKFNDKHFYIFNV